MNLLKVGNRVQGIYCGAIISGEILERRYVTTSRDAVEYTIALDTPIDLFGWTRQQVVATTREDGTPTSYCSYLNELTVQ